MAQKTNTEVWKDFIAGDGSGLVQLYEQNYVGLMNYGLRLINNRDEVNDHIMEMLLHLFERRNHLPALQNVRSYLLTCLRRKILNRTKQEMWEDLAEKPVEEIEEEQSSYEDQLIRIQSNQQLTKKLMKSFEKLTARQKEMLQLKFFEDLSYDEIAEKCNVTKRTAYNIVHDGLKVLRDDLSDDQNHFSFYQIGLILSSISFVLETAQK
ncbi:RNA polymerase sigma factor [Pedobacter sp. AW31-3R]|uniref:RNA polymerase sigma factor n=1 Tax=Pedobacter sp. AW31-3R TaxID=3445781 RepID=UPI003F9F58A8